MAPHLGARNSTVEGLLKALGGVPQAWNAPVKPDTDIFIAWRLKMCPNYKQLLKNGVTLVCLDLGYFDDTKFEDYTVSINGVHGEAMHIPVDDLSERPHPEIQPWKTDGDRVQIISTGFNRRAAKKGLVVTSYPPNWLEETLLECKRVFPTKDSYIRYHPKEFPPGEAKPIPFKDTLPETFCSVTYSSTTAVQTLIAGIPTVVQHIRSPAYDIASQELKATRPEGREEWIHELSHRNYRMDDAKEFAAAADYIMRAL